MSLIITPPAVAGGNTLTPTTANQQAIPSGFKAQRAINVLGDANLIAANILSGKSIFGVAGSVTERKYATGNASPSQTLTVSGLSFEPTVVIVYGPDIYGSNTQVSASPSISTELTSNSTTSPVSITTGTFTPSASGFSMELWANGSSHYFNNTVTWYAFG